MPLPSGSGGIKGWVVTLGRRLFRSPGRGWPWCMGVGNGGCTGISDFGASSWLLRQRDAQPGLRPPTSPAAPVFGIWRLRHLARRSGGRGSRYSGPRRHTQAEWGWGKNVAELGRMEGQQKIVVSPDLSPIWGLGKHAVITQEPRPL